MRCRNLPRRRDDWAPAVQRCYRRATGSGIVFRNLMERSMVKPHDLSKPLAASDHESTMVAVLERSGRETVQNRGAADKRRTAFGENVPRPSNGGLTFVPQGG